MNYDVYEVEIETGIPGYRLLQHVKATDADSAKVRVQGFHPNAKMLGAVLWRPCTASEVAVAVANGIVDANTTPTAISVEVVA